MEGRQRGRHFSVFTTAHRNAWKVLGTTAAISAAGTWTLAEVMRTRA